VTASRARIAIVDTGSGNLRSVQKALQVAGAEATITGDPQAVFAADKVVVPGQGAFGRVTEGLDKSGGALRQAVSESIGRGKPFFGMCLGLQVLFDGSEESPGCRGLGFVRGTVKRFALGPGYKVPHMGWNGCYTGPAADTPALAGFADETYFYFVHSYYPAPEDERDVALWSDYGHPFCAAVARDNVFACQFHPEKSQSAGLSLLTRFVSG